MENKFLSLEWFKQTAEQAIENVVAKKLETIIDEQSSVQEKDFIKTIKLVNDNLTVVLTNGQFFSKPDATMNDFEKVTTAQNVEELISIFSNKEILEEKKKIEEERQRLEKINKGVETLAKLNDFDVVENVVYLKGTSRSLPQLLVEKFIEIVETEKYYTGFGNIEDALNNNDEYQAHKNFFMWCCLNPRAEVANELYRFLHENSFRITRQGFFVALRNVVTLHGSPELVHFVSNTYNKVKAVWKKNPNEYTVFLEEGEYKIVHDDKLFTEKTLTSTTCPDCDGEGKWYDEYEDEWEECQTCNSTGEVEEYEFTNTIYVDHGENIGNLVELYLDLPNRAENRFTDDWTKTFDIRVGQLTSMPMEECNWSTQDCAAAGLK